VTLGEALRRIRGTRTEDEIAEVVGRSQATVSRWELDDGKPQLEQIAAIEDHVGRPRGTVLRAAGFVTDPDGVEDRIRADGRLDDEQMLLAIAAYRSAVRKSSSSAKNPPRKPTRLKS
jgi:transcriptional regulator with XRE-family HTH domain